jgi:hypothetical protein
MVTFTNMSQAELESLVYTLMLEWNDQKGTGLVHKLGYGKPLGLGSVRIEITRLLIEQSDDNHIPLRFYRYGDQQDYIESLDSKKLCDNAKGRWVKRHRGSYAAFSTIMRYPQSQTFLYPGYPFPSETLWAYQGRSDPHPGGNTAMSTPTPPPGGPQPEKKTPPKSPPSPPQRRSGMLGTGSQGGYAVYDGNEELPVHTAGASGKLIKKHLKRLQAGERIAVSYRREEGNTGAMASDLREEQS